MKTIDTQIDLERLAEMDAEPLLRWAFETYGDRVAIGTGLQKTGVVMIDQAHQLGIPFRVFFVDTQRNHPETYDLLAEVEKRYAITIERFAPDPQEIEDLHKSVGQYAHFLARPSCCHVRKWHPLQKALATLDVWISSLRTDQSQHRSQNARKASWITDQRGHKILKLNPMLDWTGEDVERYTREHSLPYNKLYDFVSPYGERFTIIGCTCCHIPIREGLDPRAGKFPWEQGQKECGLHQDGGGI
ncbi:hypothetical protein LCGC14_0644550 [marine sediment metagenome]|uniref:Phosphoadenosine phosphosulphate reductase domain-containing protein n=1 Tax=marine sediment metagenome TaxID=412755 RepID=A0A0F9U6F6_9ZZZZ|nr:phosphoadenylyl-sulfate reductase [Phycisphaerae bacterium]HDZ45265.1 phosphoadenylyl-sulfate reductase [Phycisphaerae bacterium]